MVHEAYSLAMARGTVMKRGTGWAFRVDVGNDPATGRRRQVLRQGFRTKREAERALDEVLGSVRSGTVVTRSSLELGAFLDEWLANQRHRLKDTTWASYEVAVGRIKQGIGRSKLQALTPLDVETFYSGLAESGRKGKPLAPKSIRNTHVVLRKALADAERLGLVPRNVAAVAKPPVARRDPRRTWSSDEVREFFSFVKGDRLFAAYVLLATTGMRRGEVLGLRWSDLDLDAGELAVVHTVTTVGYVPVVSTPKTNRSRRVVYLDEETVRVLRDHRRRQREDRLAAGPAWQDGVDFVFRDELGALVHPDWFTREFGRQVRLSGLPAIRLHDLRHTYATLALKAGVHPKIVSERLGHATVGVTLDLYSHVTPGIAREAANTVAAKLFEFT
jgi:integrase